jgi:hypothetical protein
LANKPSGSFTDKPEKYWSRSLREKVTEKAVKAPAAVFLAAAWNDGLNPDTHPEETLKREVDDRALVPDQGESELFVTYVRQALGIASGARGPLESESFKSVNGSCGLSEKVVVN